MCFLAPGSATGYCACGLRKIRFDSCAPELVGLSPQLRVNSMCLHSRDPSFQTQLRGQSYDSLLAVPCANVNGASAFCTRVSGAAAEAYMVSASCTGRSLLAIAQAALNLTHNALC